MSDAASPWQPISTAPVDDPTARRDIRALRRIPAGFSGDVRISIFPGSYPIATRRRGWSRNGEAVHWAGVPPQYEPTHWRHAVGTTGDAS